MSQKIAVVSFALWVASGVAQTALPSVAKPIWDPHASCPSGWSSSGAWCQAQSAKSLPIVAKPAYDRHASCPAGWSSSGVWCKASR